MQKNITIIGAGLVGSLLGIYLARRKYKIKVFERRADMRKEQTEAGRSINLALSDRGIKALKEVGIADEVLKIAIPMPGRFIHNADGSTGFQPYGKEGQAINSVSRAELNKKLLDLAEKENVELYFNHRSTEINWKTNSVRFDTGKDGIKSVASDIIFGADGAYSAARLQHMLQHEKFDYQQFYIDCGYKEISIPSGKNGTFLMEKNALHIWPRRDYMLIALPNLDGSFTGTLFFPFKGEFSFQNLDTESKVMDFFHKTFPDLVPLVPDLMQQFFQNPTSSLVTVKCFPWIRNGSFSLIGDAAHAIVPFFGQGMNCGFEDCSVLNRLMDNYKDNWSGLLEEFQRIRKPDCDAIADLAVNNFIEMREKTADPKFLLQKKIEAKLNEKYPDKWIPAYSMVTFSPEIPYSIALRKGQEQEAIMRQVMNEKGVENNWNTDSFLQSIIQKIQN